MPSPTEITISQRSRLIGLPGAQATVGVGLDAGYEAGQMVYDPCYCRSHDAFQEGHDWPANMNGR